MSGVSRTARLVDAVGRGWRVSCCHHGRRAPLLLGLGSGDRFEAFRGDPGCFKERMLQAKKPARLQGKRVTSAVPRSHSSDGKRGSTVRVRQRASSSCLLSRCFRCLRWQRPRSVHQRPPWTLAGAQSVEQADRMRASVAREVAVMAVDHGQAGAHRAGEVEGGDAGTEREGGESVPES
jgi:hypothetical protein